MTSLVGWMRFITDSIINAIKHNHMVQKLSFVDIEMQNSLETKASTFRLYSECYENSNSEIGNESFL